MVLWRTADVQDELAGLVLNPLQNVLIVRGLSINFSMGMDGLSRLLLSTSHCECSDPRDNVFGILGLLPPSKQKLLSDRISYQSSVEEVYTTTSEVAISQQQNLDIWDNQKLPLELRQGSEKMPSWVAFSFNDDQTREMGRPEIHDESDGWKYIMSSDSSFRFEKDILLVEGYILDHIVSASSNLSPANEAKIILNYYEKLVESYAYPSIELSHKALWQSLGFYKPGLIGVMKSFLKKVSDIILHSRS